MANHFSKVELEEVNNNNVPNKYIFIQFDSFGKNAWSVATGNALNKKLAFIIDNKLVYVPEVNTQITSGVSALNRGIYSKQDLEKFIKIIKAEK